ncbi:MAG: zinc ABC transporter substrate-binding protein [Cytophagales bacterium]|nr:zinc ABC transporter substrate-binding protein [Cytophagales bacterium]
MKRIFSLIMITTLLFSCQGKKSKKGNGKLQLVTTTTMITDLTKIVGGEWVEVQGLMGSGVDPHLYKASEGDVTKLFNSDAIIYNGLHLEGKLVEVFEKMAHQNKKTIALSDALAESDLISSEQFSLSHDPHIWFDINLWKKAVKYVAGELSKLNAKHKSYFLANADAYIIRLDKLYKDMKSKVSELPKRKRILVTAHDAFNYFGRLYDFEVVGLQGLSTLSEAGVKDVQEMAKFIIDKKLKAVFVESSIPKRTIEALQEAVRSKGREVHIGGTLFSDALGNAGTPEGTYVGMYEYNTRTIVDALK